MGSLQVRFTIRHLMLGIAIVAALIGGLRLKLRRDDMLAQAALAAHMKAAEEESRLARVEYEARDAEAARFAAEDEARLFTQAGPAPPPTRPDDDDPTFTETDRHILDALLKVLIEDDKFSPAGRGTRLIVVPEIQALRMPKDVDANGKATFEPFPDWQIEDWDRQDDCLAEVLSREVWRSWARRNTKKNVSLARYRPSNDRVSVQDAPKTEFGLGSFRGKYPDTKGYLFVSLPGYSKDAKTVGIHFDSGPGHIHGGPSGDYVFTYRSGRWVFRCRRLLHGM